MHISQVTAVEGAIINLQRSETTVGLIFICLRRAKRLMDMLIELMPFDRLS